MAGLLGAFQVAAPLSRVAGGLLANDPTLNPAIQNLSPVQRGFLAMMRGAENIGAAGTSLKMYNDIIQRGRTAPITEADFSPDELGAIREMVKNKMAITGQPVGHIDYRDYPGGNLMVADRSKASGEIMNTLGGFNYDAGNGNIRVSDTYDFNANRGGAGEGSQAAQLLGAILYPRNLAASIGRQILPSTSGSGVPVSISIGGQ